MYLVITEVGNWGLPNGAGNGVLPRGQRLGMRGQTVAFVVPELEVEHGLGMRDAGDLALHFRLIRFGEDAQRASGMDAHPRQTLQAEPAERGLAAEVLPFSAGGDLQREAGGRGLGRRDERAETKVFPWAVGGLAAERDGAGLQGFALAIQKCERNQRIVVNQIRQAAFPFQRVAEAGSNRNPRTTN